MPDRAKIDLNSSLIDAFASNSPSQGLTHTFYRYPARFSPQFVRAVIQTFSRRGDCVLDPFMGSGTTLVEALAHGRHAVGTDINPLALFLARTKTSILSRQDNHELETWLTQLPQKLEAAGNSGNHEHWAEDGYHKDLPWPIRRQIERV